MSNQDDNPKLDIYKVVQEGEIDFACGVIYTGNKNKGFWDSKREVGTLLMLCTSELAEALEADRKGRNADLATFEKSSMTKTDFETHVKDTFEDELADTVIRIFDLCGHLGIPIGKHINYKLAYNATRGRKHGKNY